VLVLLAVQLTAMQNHQLVVPVMTSLNHQLAELVTIHSQNHRPADHRAEATKSNHSKRLYQKSFSQSS
jgi:hypothetical protein